MLKGILFDLDGVIVDSEEIYFRAVRDTFQRYGIEISRGEYVRRWMIEQTTSQGAIRDYKLPFTLEQVRKLKETFEEKYKEDLKLMPQALDLLYRYRRLYPLGLVSSASKKDITKKLKQSCKSHDLIELFTVIVSGDDVKNKKPDREPYQKGCELLGLDPKYVLVIEDNPSGVKSAKDAGCIVIARPDGFTRDLDFTLADKVIVSFDEINDGLIAKLFS